MSTFVSIRKHPPPNTQCPHRRAELKHTKNMIIIAGRFKPTMLRGRHARRDDG
jgi:hypothetical protein